MGYHTVTKKNVMVYIYIFSGSQRGWEVWGCGQGEVIYSSGDFWHCPEIFLVVTTWRREYYWH